MDANIQEKELCVVGGKIPSVLTEGEYLEAEVKNSVDVLCPSES